MRSIAATLVLLSFWSYSIGSSSDNALQFALLTDDGIATEVQSAINESINTINEDLLQETRLEYTTVIYNKSNILQLSVPNYYSTIALIIGGVFPIHCPVNNSSLPVVLSFFYNVNDHPGANLYLVPSDSSLAKAVAVFLSRFGWQQVAMATRESRHYIEVYEDIEVALLEKNINIVKNVTLTRSSTCEELFDTDAHVFILNLDSETAAQTLCKAYHNRLYYPNYLWIILGGPYQVNWWTNYNISGCNSNHIQTVLSYSIKATSIISKLNGRSTLSMYAQDAVLALAIGLNITLSTTESDKINSTALQKALKSVQFDGTTGFVNFTAEGKRQSNAVLFEQYRPLISDSSLYVQNVSLFDAETGFVFYDNINKSTVFPIGIPPDGTPVIIVNTIRIEVYSFSSVLFALGMLLAITCFLFNIIFRHRKIVKLTSPNLNYVIILGVVILLFGLILYSLPIKDAGLHRALCTVRRFFSSIGHDIAFTVALLKTWRVHYIFRSPSPNKRASKDWHLLVSVFAIISFDFILSVALLVPDAIFTSAGLEIDREMPSYRNEQGVLKVFYILDCGTTYFYLTWVILTAVFKLVIHVVAIVLSFRVRKIEVDAVNDYKYTSAIVYSSSVLLLLLVVAIFALNDFVNVLAATLDLLIFLEVIIFLGFTYIPKMVHLYKDPKGKQVFTSPHHHELQGSVGTTQNGNTQNGNGNTQNGNKPCNVTSNGANGTQGPDNKDSGIDVSYVQS